MGRNEPVVRRSVIAGSWYPGTAAGLKRAVDEYFSHVDEPLLEGQLLGLVSPHAGYAYSGQTAAHAYRQLEGRPVSTVVILAPSHRAWVGDYAVSAEDAYETPLGRVPLDAGFVAELEKRVPLPPIRNDLEHALEIQLPFVQSQLPEFRLVPILMSADDPAVAEQLGAALAEVARQRQAPEASLVLVASSDMHHIESYNEVVRRDQPVVDAVAAFDLPTLTRLLMDPRCTVCGRMPILAVLHACQALGANETRVLYHTNSGDVTGQRQPGQYTVGYMAAAILKST